MKPWAIAAVSLLALAACTPAAQTGAASSAPLSNPAAAGADALLPPPSPAHVRRFSLGEEDYVHAPTGFRFPAQAGAMVRSHITEYTATREDVSVDYVLSGPVRQKVLVSVYVFPVWNMAGRRITLAGVPSACATAYDYAHDQMRQYALNPRLFREGVIPAGRFTGATLHMAALYDADGVAQSPGIGPIRTALYFHCAVDKVWIVMYRVTRPQGFAVEPKIEDLMDRVPVKPAS